MLSAALRYFVFWYVITTTLVSSSLLSTVLSNSSFCTGILLWTGFLSFLGRPRCFGVAFGVELFIDSSSDESFAEVSFFGRPR